MNRKRPKESTHKEAKKRSEAERERDRVLVGDLRVKGYSQQEIADYLNNRPGIHYQITRSLVQADLRIIEQRWIDRMVASMDTVKAELIASITKRRNEAWRAWERSQEDEVVSTTERTDGDATAIKAKLQRKGQVGDARFLDIIKDCDEQLAKIYGLYAPKKIEADIAMAMPPVLPRYDDLDDEELAALITQKELAIRAITHVGSPVRVIDGTFILDDPTPLLAPSESPEPLGSPPAVVEG